MGKILAFDIDGVLVDWHHSVYTYFEYECNYLGDYQTFWLDYIPSLSKEKQDYIVSLPFLYETQIPPKNVTDFLDYCASHSDDIYYITHRPVEVERITKQYFKRYDFPYPDNIIFTGDKVTACRYVGATHFLDDFVKHVEAVKGVCDSYLMAKCWNRDFQDGYKTVHSLKEFQERIFV
jgi:uncharacterized HAD superfamily protein